MTKVQKNESPDQTVCPSCGRYVGPYESCPYCGAHLKKRLSIRIFKYFAVIYSLAGLILLYIAAVHIKTPVVKIKDISSTMNFAHIRLQGVIAREPKYNPDSQSLILTINDSTGSLSVAMFQETAVKVKNKYNPALGDIVDAEGSLRIKNKFTSLTVTSADNFSLKKSSPVKLSYTNTLSDYINKKIIITGKILSISQYKNFVPVILDWNKIKIKIPIYKNSITSEVRQLKKSDIIEIEGFLTKPGNIFTLTPITVSFKSHSASKQSSQRYHQKKIIKIKDINNSRLKQRVKIKGTIKRISSIKKGKLITAEDETGTIAVILWNSAAEKLPQNVVLETNKLFIFKGQVKEYKKKLEIIPQYADDIIPLKD